MNSSGKQTKNSFQVSIIFSSNNNKQQQLFGSIFSFLWLSSFDCHVLMMMMMITIIIKENRKIFDDDHHQRPKMKWNKQMENDKKNILTIYQSFFVVFYFRTKWNESNRNVCLLAWKWVLSISLVSQLVNHSGMINSIQINVWN